MKLKLFIPLFFIFASCQTARKPAPKPEPVELDTTKSTALSIAATAFDGASVGFEAHDSYLSMSLPYKPFQSLFAQVEVRAASKLQSRGEAHVTVVSPPEFAILKSRLSVTDINAAAEKIGIQTTEIQPVCVGEGHAKVGGADEKTYFVVIRAQNLVRIRHDLQRMFVSYGGDKTKFDPDRFHPHVTLGFTKTDLFEEQGVIKDENSCKFSLVVMGTKP